MSDILNKIGDLLFGKEDQKFLDIEYNGVTYQVEDASVGNVVSYVDENGESVILQDGEVVTEDGAKIIVSEGVISDVVSVEEPEVEEEMDESAGEAEGDAKAEEQLNEDEDEEEAGEVDESSERSNTEEEIEDLKKQVAELKEILMQFHKVSESFNEDISKFNLDMIDIKERLETPANQPIENKKVNKFYSNKITTDEINEKLSKMFPKK